MLKISKFQILKFHLYFDSGTQSHIFFHRKNQTKYILKPKPKKK